MDHFCHTGKKQYESKAAAEEALRMLRQDPRRPERRSYFCASCGGWHLTHKTQDRGNGPYHVRRKRDAKIARVLANLRSAKPR